MPISYERWRIITFKKIIGATFFLSSMLLLRMFWIGKERNVKQHQIRVTKSGENKKTLTIFFITDIHRRKIDERLLKKVKQGVDLVIIGGDLAEKGVPLSRIDRNVKKLSTLGQVFFVWGNNDREVGETALREIIARHEGIILDNENQSIPLHPAWGICGTDDPSCEKYNIEQALNQIEPYQHVLFVSHQPIVWRRIEQFIQPTLLLAGHTHGGQIRFGKFGIGERGAFTMSEGRAKLISNGYGTTSVPLRLGAHPESHLLTIYYSEV